MIAPRSVLVDTSVAVALVVADHAAHRQVLEGLAGRRLGLSGHAAFETYSVLTRLPPPARRDPSTVSRLVADNFPATVHLTPERAVGLLSGLPDLGIAGGAVYDALVGAAAAEHRLTLFTRDVRALDTYRAVGAEVAVIGGGPT
ncbi:MAG: type II toxin-antitoxin system VapC family toxin [Microthrixaceae bacterium]